MYGHYFNIDESAFSIAPNPKYLYLSSQHEEALAHLMYGVTRPGGFVLITGEIGTGKTTICRSLFKQIPDNTDIALIINPKLNTGDLLASICDELKISYSKYQASPKTYIGKLNEYLIKSHAQGRNTILIIDEAQNLSFDALENIRVLTNLETDEQKLLQIILIGQPELRDRLNSSRMEQLNQRITARFHLRALSPKQVKEYIKHRLEIGDGNKELFSNSNINCISRMTGGVPRLINVLCDRTLLGAYVRRDKKITNEVIQKAAREALGKQVKRSVFSINWAMILALSIAALLIAATALIFVYEKDPEFFAATENTKKSSEMPPIVSPIESESSTDSNVKMNNTVPIIQETENEVQIDSPPLIVEQSAIATPLGDEVVISKDTDATELDEQVVEQRSEPELALVESNAEIEDSPVMQEIAIDEKVDTIVELSPRQWAYRKLFEAWQVDYADINVDPCEFAKQQGLFCYKSTGDIRTLLRLNRPVILINGYESNDADYLVIEKLEQNQLLVHEPSGQRLAHSAEIERVWQGKFELLWKPIAQVRIIRPNMQGEFVNEIDRSLSIILNRPPSFEELKTYNKTLVKEVKAFQRMQNIGPDGAIGPLTQIYMNNLVGSEIPKLR